MITVYIFSNQHTGYQNQQHKLPENDCHTLDDCLSSLPPQLAPFCEDVRQNSSQWSIIMDGALLECNAPEQPLGNGKAVYIFPNNNYNQQLSIPPLPLPTGPQRVAPAKKLRGLIEEKGLIIAPGVYNALIARMAEARGFAALHVGGNALSCTLLGLPDLGFLSPPQILSVVRHIAAAVDVPVIADADTGYGDEKNVWHTIRQFLEAGVAGLHIEDQAFPKRCGFMSGRSVIHVDDMVKKIQSAKRAAADPDFCVIARTDAIESRGFSDAVYRANIYLQAGADMVFVSAIETEKQLEQLPSLVDGPVMLNMAEAGKLPLRHVSELEQMGYKLAIYSLTTLLSTAYAVDKSLEALAKEGITSGVLPMMMQLDDLNALLCHSRSMYKED